MKRLIVLAAATMIGCGFQINDSHQYLYYIDPAFSLDQQGAIRSAINEWEYATDGNITFVETAAPNGSHLIQIESWDHTASLKDAAIGRTFPYYETIQINSNLDARITRETALHEIGHALGLGHDQVGTIMSGALVVSVEHITCRDVFQFCEIWHCFADNLPPCKEK